MPGKKQHKGIFHTKVNELSIYQLIQRPQFTRSHVDEITKTREGSTSFNIYRGRTKLESKNGMTEAIKFAEKYKFEITKKKQRKLGLIK
ncbi:hypothetical protein COB55_06055 [Candidatus Wolfebacteria bacterium]|nr:MAG: hypothetical protein COB55_06055 [Candidatus Wolfebacteria bacterium]